MVTLSFNLAPGASLGEAVDAIEQAQSRNWACRRVFRPASRERRRHSKHSLGKRAVSDPGGAGHGLHRAGHSLRELHPSDHDSFHVAIGRRGRDPGAAICARTDFSVIALIGIILLIGIVKKNAIMMIDFALEAERKDGKTPAGRDL